MDTVDNLAEVVKVLRVEPHPNADRLDLVFVRGWQVVARKGGHKPGDLCVYIPIDSVLPHDLEEELFPVGSKITLTKSRVKTIKIRGAISQGMILPTRDAAVTSRIEDPIEGLDVTGMLGITHYEPPVRESPQHTGGGTIAKRKNTFFKEYSKMGHFKNYPDLFADGEQVIVTEKIHGTNFRAGWVPCVADTWWKKVKAFFGYLPEWEFLYGSHRVQYTPTKQFSGYYKTNVYKEAVEKYGLESRIPKGFVVYGEIYGSGIQKGYDYGLPEGERRLALFDVLVTTTSGEQRWLDWAGVEAMSEASHVPTVPVIYDGEWEARLVPAWESGPSVVGHSHASLKWSQEHREGIVVKPRIEQQTWVGRKMLRSINPEYSMVAESDFH